MKEHELQAIIDQLTAAHSQEAAYFGIFQYGGVPEESCIRANQAGLALFAADLLKALRDAEEVLTDEKKDIIPLNYEAEWIGGETVIHYVEPIAKSSKNLLLAPDLLTWRDTALKTGCLALLLLGAVAMVVGLVVMVRWVF